MVAGLYPFGGTEETEEPVDEANVQEDDEKGSPIRVASLATGDVVYSPGGARVVAAPGEESFDMGAEELPNEDDLSIRSRTSRKAQRPRPEPIDTTSLADGAVDETNVSIV